MRQNLRGDPRAGVRDGEHDVRSVRERRRDAFLRPCELRGADREPDDAAACHRVASVHDEVQDDLLDLHRVGQDRRHAVGQVEVELDVLADRAA